MRTFGLAPDVAEELVACCLKASVSLDESTAVAQGRLSPEAFDAYRRAIGSVMGELFDQVLRPIWKEHPHLDPTIEEGTE